MRALGCALAVLAGCGDDSGGGAVDAGVMEDGGGGMPDAVTPDVPSTACTTDEECDDATFCNGVEACDPAAAGADSRGCVSGPGDPCMAGQTCDETGDRCATMCDVMGDADGDGHDSADCGGDDCDDADAARYPGNAEICDAADVDEDCDAATVGARDADGDGLVAGECCNRRADGIRACGDDCDDLRRNVNPDASEVCDGFDNDCDASTDEGVMMDGFVDGDRDLHGDGTMPIRACPGSPGFSPVGDDCDDADSLSHGAQREVCNGVDDDCDAEVDEGAGALPWYPDSDGDGFGDPDGTPVMSCSPIAGYRLLATDCDDADPAVNPGIAELCNGRDDDCDGRADYRVGDGDTEDDDLDGAPDAACASGADADCDDRDPTVLPGAPELVDGRDNDCDGTVDGACDMTTWYVDGDGDGWGNPGLPTMRSCDPIPGRVTRAGDCADDDGARSPGTRDVCNGVDDDCNGEIDQDAARFCAVPHALAICDMGTCDIGACDRRYDDCGPMAGCETDISRSAANCGTCGNVCASGPRSLAACDDFECGLTCSVGFLDCDGVATTGCEVDSVADARNCGRCGMTCSSRPRATGVCTSSTCAIECDAGYSDCDGDLGNGCEAWIAGDAANCGGCGMACAVAGDVCVRTSCVAPAYPPTTTPTMAFAPTGSMTLPSGTLVYTTITIPAGVVIRTDGAGVLDLRATGDVIIRGTIDVSGQPGDTPSYNSGGSGGATGLGALAAPVTDGCGTIYVGGGGSGQRGGDAGDGGAGGGCGQGGAFGGGGGGRQGGSGGGGGGYAGGSGGSSSGSGSIVCGPSGAGASVVGAGRGGAAAACEEPGRGGEFGMLAAMGLAAYEGGDANDSTPGAWGHGGGGGSIGFAAAMDLPVGDATFYPGSGGGGGGGDHWGATGGNGGGGAGGAVRISSLTSIVIDGSVTADGAIGGHGMNGFGGGGSGGVIYIAAPSVRFGASAIVSARGAPGVRGGTGDRDGGAGGLGRVRISTLSELCSLAGSITPSLVDGCTPTPGAGTPERVYVGAYPN